MVGWLVGWLFSYRLVMDLLENQGRQDMPLVENGCFLRIVIKRKRMKHWRTALDFILQSVDPTDSSWLE